jgi:hypothetical protein
MKVVRPLPISLTASSVPENDYPAWDTGATYALGARVIVAGLHRVFESVIAGNQGHNPATAGAGFWIDAGPTNRWAMFDPAAGPATSATAAIVVTLALPDAVDAIGLVDLQAASVRVEIATAAGSIFDETRGAPAACEVFLTLPAGAARSATVTITPAAGAAAIVGKLVAGASLDLGTLADAPTVGLTDFSRRDTDQFGVTTIVQRGWTKRIEGKCRVDTAAVDGIQRQLAAIRAQAALWIGEGDIPSLISYGFFKDFSQIVSLQGISTCSLSIDGLPAADIAVPVSDPAFEGVSDFQVVRPLAVTDAVLIASSVAENDYPVYSPDRTYIAGERVLDLSAHRVYESAAGGNKGNLPGADTTHWVDVGPAKRWAMFDQALGTATTAAGSITVQLRPDSSIDSLALLDVVATSVRVQSPGYDRTQTLPPDSTTALFLDLAVAAGADVTVTVTASAGAVSVGTLLIGAREGLGLLADAPTVSIIDFSSKETDDFGNTVPVERAWAKRMEAQSQVATPAVDALLRRIATLRAVPALWIGAAEFEALTIYGFFRNFAATLGAQVSTTSVTIEGLAKAAPDVPSDEVVRWENITGPGKPADNATVGAPPGTNVGDVPAEQIADAVKDANGNVVPARQQFAAVKAEIDAAVSDAQDEAAAARDDVASARNDLAIEVQRAKDAEGAINVTLAAVKSTADGASAAVTDEATVRARDDIALSNRVSTTEAQLSGGQDSGLRARIVTEETTRANQDNAIAARVSTTEAQLNGSQDSNLRARIATEETTRASQDAALANRASAIEAIAVIDGASLNGNPTFKVWGNPLAPPDGWVWWDASAGIVRASGVNGRPFAAQFNASANQNSGIMQGLNAAFGAFVIEFTGRASDWQGAGVLAQFLTDTGVWVEECRVSAAATPDSSGYQSADGGGGAYTRTFSAFYKTGINGAIRRVQLFAMANWDYFGERRAKTIAFDRVSIRPATAAEIAGQRADISATEALGRITTEETTRANQDTALANRITTTEAQLAGSQGSNLQSRVANEETARANQDAALANRTTTVEAQLNGTQGSALGSRVTTTESAIANLNGRTSAYWQVLAVAGNNRAQMTLHADANGGAGVDIVGDVTITGSDGDGSAVIGGRGVFTYYPNGAPCVRLGRW